MGRPAKKDAERRDKPLRIRLASQERKAIDKAATAKGLDTSTWARMVLLEASKVN
jgi:predicted DNA binding CopG/RHH family protein